MLNNGIEKGTQDRIARKRGINRKSIIIIAAIALGIALMLALCLPLLSSNISQIAALKKHIFSNTVMNRITAEAQANPALGEAMVFLSLCNGEERALVVKGKGKTLKAAFKDAATKAEKIVAEKEYHVQWVKADIVSSAERIPTVDLNKELVECYYPYFFRKGIAFDWGFNTAFLEGEINGNKMLTYYTEQQMSHDEIDYNAVRLHLVNINNYLKTYYGYQELLDIPENIIIFTTQGFFCEKDGSVYDLHNQGLNSGRRKIELADDKTIETVILNASNYLYDMMQPDGKFIYGYYPIFDNTMTSYNILRHTGSIWSLINLYRMTHDPKLIFKLDMAISYLLNGAIEYKNPDTAFVVERKADEIKLGGNGLAIIMLTEYMDVFETDEYVDIVRALANGILEMQDRQTGTYYHVYNFPGFSEKEAYRTVYYDGEATFGLTRAYTYTREQKYLQAAEMAVDNFIAKNYTKYRDHWVAYSLNEITKYVEEPRYYEFALKNVQDNLQRIYNQPTSYHTYLELLMVGWQTYERMLQSGLNMEDLDNLDKQRFAETIYKRVFHMLNNYFYPEVAMYMKKPAKALDTFFVRHDNFRIRIDDIQHFIGGYYYYTVYYEQIRPFLSDEFLQSIHKEALLVKGGDDEIDVEVE
ncbi:MAG: glycosyl hydrolase family 88 [Clostridiales bacterium]|nr:glycosyl hydrolase family 88 [Clostridiales bacterium]